MAASPSSVITLGLGSWGSSSLVATLGYGAGVATTDACSMWPRGMWPDGMWPDTCPVETVGGGGGLDPGEGIKRKRARNIVKPLGLPVRPLRKKPATDDQAKIEQRIENALSDTELDGVATGVKRDAVDAAFEAFKPAQEMSIAEIDAEIKRLMQKTLLDDEDERMLLLLLAASM